MPLDSNLFTLSLSARNDSSGFVDLREDSLDGSTIYSAIKENDRIRLVDHYTEAVLASASVVAPKLRLVELNEPTQVIEIKSTGSLSWQWGFAFEEKVNFNVKREIVSVGSERGYIISISRKPDPDWPVLIYKPATSKKKATFQLLDFNFQRLDYRIQDSKGLEILMLTVILSFLDNLWPTSPSPSPLPTPSALPAIPTSIPTDSPSPALDRVTRRMSSLDLANNKSKETGNIGKDSASTSSLSANEIVITDKSNASDLTSRILKLLSDESLMYVVLLAESATSSQLAVRIAEEAKRKHYKSTGEELKQYVLPDSERSSSSSDKKFASTSNIKIYISRLSLDELLPAYKKKTPAFKPRPPIVLDSPSKPAVETRRTPEKLEKSKKPSGKPAEEPTPKKSGWGFFS